MTEQRSRNQDIYRARLAGRTFGEIAGDFHISAQRARYIYNRECLIRQCLGDRSSDRIEAADAGEIRPAVGS